MLQHGFVNFDDDEYVTDNFQVRQGLSAAGARWALTTFHQGNWHPLTWLSHMLDVQLYGLSPGGHHLTSLLLHLGNTNLVFLILAALTGTIWPSALVAALFGVHPLHVESVAWVAERKDVLSTFFGLLALRTYVGYARIPAPRLFYASLLLFLLALSAKAMVVTLPFVFMLLDWWPLGRYRFAGGKRRVAGLVLEKAPLLFAAGVCAVLTVGAQQQGGALAGSSVAAYSGTAANALVSYVRYLGMTSWPSRLAVFYPFQDVSAATVAASALLLCGVALFVLHARRGHPYLALGLFWYLGTLLPVIGIVQVGAQGLADRYTYVPLVGIFIMVAWGAGTAIVRAPAAKPLVLALLGTAVIALGWAARVQVGYWQDSVTLFSRALAVTSDNWLAHHNLALALDEEGRAGEAIGHYEKTLALNAQFPQVHVNLGAALAARGRKDEARRHYLEALRLDPRNAEAHNNLGVLLGGGGRLQEEEARYRAALAAKPDYAAALNNLGALLAEQGRYAEAIPLYRQALRIEPDFAVARENLQQALGR